MMQRTLFSYWLACCVAAQSAGAEPPVEQTVNWAQFRQEAASRRLAQSTASVGLASGEQFKCTLLRVEDSGLVVESTRETGKRWTAQGRETLIPRAEVATVRFHGRYGRKGLLGGLIGLGAGAATAAGLWSNSNLEANRAIVYILVLVPALAVGGFLIGNALDKRGPHFRIVPSAGRP